MAELTKKEYSIILVALSCHSNRLRDNDRKQVEIDEVVDVYKNVQKIYFSDQK